MRLAVQKAPWCSILGDGSCEDRAWPGRSRHFPFLGPTSVSAEGLCSTESGRQRLGEPAAQDRRGLQPPASPPSAGAPGGALCVPPSPALGQCVARLHKDGCPKSCNSSRKSSKSATDGDFSDRPVRPLPRPVPCPGRFAQSPGLRAGAAPGAPAALAPLRQQSRANGWDRGAGHRGGCPTWLYPSADPSASSPVTLPPPFLRAAATSWRAGSSGCVSLRPPRPLGHQKLRVNCNSRRRTRCSRKRLHVWEIRECGTISPQVRCPWWGLWGMWRRPEGEQGHAEGECGIRAGP